MDVAIGNVTFEGEDILELEPEERAHRGLFLSFQYPVEIPGVSMVNFMRAALNERRKAAGLDPLPAAEFLKLMKQKRELVELDNKLASRSVNEGFSGGEKKRNEIFQMAMLEPKLAILDETDSGLDIDALRIVAKGVNELRSPRTLPSSSRTTSVSWTISAPTSCTSSTRVVSYVAVAPSSLSNSKSVATTGSRKR